jgi:hypothetical protein
LRTLPARAKTLVPLLVGADAAEPFAAVENDDGDVGPGFDVVDQRGLAEQAADGRERRTGPRHAAGAFDRVDQGGFLAADEGAGAEPDLDVKLKSGAQDVLAEEPVLAGGGNGLFSRLMASGYSARI